VQSNWRLLLNDFFLTKSEISGARSNKSWSFSRINRENICAFSHNAHAPRIGRVWSHRRPTKCEGGELFKSSILTVPRVWLREKGGIRVLVCEQIKDFRFTLFRSLDRHPPLITTPRHDLLATPTLAARAAISTTAWATGVLLFCSLCFCWRAAVLMIVRLELSGTRWPLVVTCGAGGGEW
jgi:hypothetical protein